MNPWLPMNILIALIALIAIGLIHRQRRAHDRELIEKHTRLYKGALLG